MFRNGEATRLIKRCNDFGAGGVSVAIGELADGIEINLNAVPKKYEGLDGTELAISESQERMAVVVEGKDVESFKKLAELENLEATVVARVTELPRLVMKWNDAVIVDISREFLNSNGAEKHINIEVNAPERFDKEINGNFTSLMSDLASDLNVCSKRGLSERFDSTIGAGSVLMPFGGKNQSTPTQVMVNKVSVEKADTDTCSFMSWGYNPFISEKSPYHGAYLAVVESASKLIAGGADFSDTYLTFQEYFEKPRKEAKRWGKPLAALLGAFKAQKDLGIAAIGGKDSMSGSFENIDVPPTLVSFAVTTGKLDTVTSAEFKLPFSKVVWIRPEYDENGLPNKDSLLEVYAKVSALTKTNKALAVYTPTYGGVAEAVMKMCFGNGLGFKYADGITLNDIFGYSYGSFIIELADGVELDGAVELGTTTAKAKIVFGDEDIALDSIYKEYEDVLESVYPTNAKESTRDIPAFSYDGKKAAPAIIKCAKPKVLIPVFPGTNCEYDSAKAFERAGAETEIFVINNLSAAKVSESVESFVKKIKQSQIIFVPGGFSGGDEPDGSGKFITAFFRNGAIKNEVNELLKNRDGLMCGICNGFQALIKLGLVPYGEIIDTDENCPTLTYNSIGRHQSRIVRTRIASNSSPWLSQVNVGDIYSVPISHGEGRFLASEELILKLAENGQIATQYVDLEGKPTSNILYNPNNSCFAVEGITSPDGRVLGKMGHTERYSNGLYSNVEGNYDMKIFESAVKYFK